MCIKLNSVFCLNYAIRTSAKPKPIRHNILQKGAFFKKVNKIKLEKKHARFHTVIELR